MEIALRDQYLPIKTEIAIKINKLINSESETLKSNQQEKRIIQDIIFMTQGGLK